MMEFATRVDAFLRTSAVAARSVSNLATRVDLGEGEGRTPYRSTSQNLTTRGYALRIRLTLVTRLKNWNVGHPMFTNPLSAVCRGLGGYLWRARVDDAVAINNWLISTNLYPDLDRTLLRRWTGRRRIGGRRTQSGSVH